MLILISGFTWRSLVLPQWRSLSSSPNGFSICWGSLPESVTSLVVVNGDVSILLILIQLITYNSRKEKHVSLTRAFLIILKCSHTGQIRSDQLLSRVWLCDPMNCSIPGLPVHHQLPEFTQTHVHRVSDAIQPSHPLSSPSPLAPNPSQHQSLFQWVNSSHEVAKVLEFQL